MPYTPTGASSTAREARLGFRLSHQQERAALIPPPRGHRHRYHGVLAPNATLRAAVTALAREASNNAQEQTGQEKEATEDAVEALWRSPARYLWAMLLARIYESAPLACPHCGADMRIIAFVTDGLSVSRALACVGEPTNSPTSACRILRKFEPPCRSVRT